MHGCWFKIKSRLLVQNLTTMKHYKSFDVAKVTKSLKEKTWMIYKNDNNLVMPKGKCSSTINGNFIEILSLAWKWHKIGFLFKLFQFLSYVHSN